MVRSESLMPQLALVQKGTGVALVPEPSVRHYAPIRKGSCDPLRI